MGRFDRYLLSQLLIYFGFFSLVLILVYWINRAVVLFDALISDGQTFGVFLELTALTLPNLIRIVLPIAAFAASTYVTNRMTAESELIVVQATGYSSYRLARPVMVFGLFVAGLMLALTHFLVPASTLQLNERQSEIAQNATARFLREGQFMTPSPGFTFYIREVTPEGELRDIFLSDSRRAAETVTYTASSAFLVRSGDTPQLVMIDGLVQTLRHEGGRLVTASFDDLAYDIGAMIELPQAGRRSSRELFTPELFNPTPEILAETRKTVGELFIEAHDRFSQAILATVAAMLGFATLLTGGFSRFGVWKQILVAILLVILVKLVETSTVALMRDRPSLWPLSYMPAALGFAIVWFLLTWAARPHLFRRLRRNKATEVAA